MGTQIHPTAIIEPGAQIGAGCQIHSYAVITRFVRLAENVVVNSFAVIGGDPQFLNFDPKKNSYVEIGPDCVLREHVTINRSMHEGGSTHIGAAGYFMASSHAGHDCVVGKNVVVANGTLLAGHVQVGDFAFFGGGAAVHQHCRIGESVMVAGHASITRDVPPFTMVAERDDLIGCNLVGLRRRNFDATAIAEIKNNFRAVFAGGNPRQIAAEKRTAEDISPEAAQFLDFFASGKRGFARPRRRSGLAKEESGDFE